MNHLYLETLVPIAFWIVLSFWLLEITQLCSFYRFIHFLWLAHGMQILEHRQSMIDSRCCWETTWHSTFKHALDVWVHANHPTFLPDLLHVVSLFHCDVIYLMTIRVECVCIGHLSMLGFYLFFFILPSSLSLGNLWQLYIFFIKCVYCKYFSYTLPCLLIFPFINRRFFSRII